MRLVFVHDGPLYYDKDGNYFEFAYHELYERYSYIANEILFLIRIRPIAGVNKFTKVPPQIQIVAVPNFKSPKLYYTEKTKAERIIEKTIETADYVVLRTQSSIAQLALKYVKKYRKPYFVESVGCTWDSYWNHGILGKLVAPYMFMMTKKAIREAPYVYYVTEKFLQKRYPTKGKSVGCSNVVIDSPDEKVLQERLKRQNNRIESNSKFVLGTAAALDTRYKGHEYVIKAICELEKSGYQIEYRLAGGNAGAKPNNFLADLVRKKGVQDKVVFVGSLSCEQMNEYYDSLDIYVQPSKQEGLPRAVIEAMSRGCPVLGTDIAGIPELIQKECLFRKGSTKSFIQAFKRILELDLDNIAIRNFNTAKKYEREVLREKRKKFYDRFLMEYK